MGNYDNATVKQEKIKVFRCIANSKYYRTTITRFVILGKYPKVKYKNMWRNVEFRNGSWELCLCA